VIVAEDITSRFLNVISLFNGSIPLVAIQLGAFRLGDSVSLVCSKVLDEMRLGLVDDDEPDFEVANRTEWEDRASKQTLAMADEVLEMVRAFDGDLELNYTKFYIGLAKGGRPNNFVIFRPKKGWLLLEVRLDRSDEMQAQLKDSGLDPMEYDSRFGRYRIRLAKGDITTHKDFLAALMTKAYAGTA
jgi:hypothetical protein